MLAYCQDATSPQSGQTSPEQAAQAQAELRRRVHSEQVHVRIPGQIPERLARESGDIRLRNTQAHGDIVLIPDPLANLWQLTCQSDMVVLGKIESGTSYPTVDQSYIYTDWNLNVEESIKNNEKAPVEQGQTVVVTRPGGAVEINGRRVYTLSSDRELHAGDEVLLYLRYLPATRAYSLSWPTGFILSDSKISNLNKTGYIQSETTDKIGLLDLARQAANEICPKRPEGQK